jgi:hypothetical protein
MPSGRRAHLILLIIIATSTALKLGLVVFSHGMTPVLDAWDYYRAGNVLARTGSYNSSRAPLYPAVIAGAIVTSRACKVQEWGAGALCPPIESKDLVRVALVAMSGLTVWMIYLIGVEIFDRRAGLMAAGLFAFYPNLVSYTALLWAETQFIMLNVAWVLLLLLAWRRQNIALFAVTGLVFGCAVLTRQVVMSFSVLVVAWMLLMRPEAWRNTIRFAAAIAFTSLLVVGTWTTRNAIVHEAFVPVEPNSGIALLFGAVTDMNEKLAEAKLGEPRSLVERDAWSGAEARRIIRADPAAYVQKMFQRNLPGLWQPNSMLLLFLQTPSMAEHRKNFPTISAWLARSIMVATIASYAFVMLTAAAGLALAPDWRQSALTIAMVMHASLLHAIVSGTHRHRLYVMAFLTLYSAFALSRSRAQLRNLLADRRWIAIAAPAATLLLIVYSTDFDLVRGLWRKLG